MEVWRLDEIRWKDVSKVSLYAKTLIIKFKTFVNNFSSIAGPYQVTKRIVRVNLNWGTKKTSTLRYCLYPSKHLNLHWITLTILFGLRNHLDPFQYSLWYAMFSVYKYLLEEFIVKPFLLNRKFIVYCYCHSYYS